MTTKNTNTVAAAAIEAPMYEDYDGAAAIEAELPSWAENSQETAIKASAVSADEAQRFVDGLGLNEDVDNQSKFDKSLSIKAYKAAMKAYQKRAPEYISAFLTTAKTKFSPDDCSRLRSYFRYAGFAIKGCTAILLAPSQQLAASKALRAVTVRTLRIKPAPKKIEAAATAYEPTLEALKKCTAAAQKAADKTGTIDAKLQEGGAALHAAKTAEWTFATRVQKAASYMALIERNGGDLEAVLRMLEGMSKESK